MDQIKLTEKNQHDILQRLLIDEFALIHFNPKSEGVSVPEQFLNQDVLTLKLSKLYRGRLIISQEEISAELLFDEYFTCIVPLKIIWGMTSYKGETYIWPNVAGLPAAYLANKSDIALATKTEDLSEKEPAPRKAKVVPHLTRVK